MILCNICYGINKLKVAVIMTGHLRTWNYCKKYIIKTLDTLIPSSKDWYVAYWESTTSSENEILKFLQENNQNVIKIRYYSIDENKRVLKENFEHKYTPVGRPIQFFTIGYLNYYIGIEKRLYEYKNNIKYDIVFNIRPDIVYAINDDSKKYFDHIMSTHFEDFALQISGDVIIDQKFSKLGGPSVDDLCQITGFLSSDMLSMLYFSTCRYEGVFQRTYLRGGNCAHTGLPQYLGAHLIQSRKIDWLYRDRDIFMSPKLIRPNIPFEDLENQLNNWNGRSTGYHFWDEKYENEWKNISNDERKNICEKMHIDPNDYGI